MSSALPNPFQPVTYQAGGTAANSQSNTFPVSTIKMSYPAVVWYCWMFGKCCKPGLAYRRGEEQQVPFCCMEHFSISLPKAAWTDAADPCARLTPDIPG